MVGRDRGSLAHPKAVATGSTVHRPRHRRRGRAANSSPAHHGLPAPGRPAAPRRSSETPSGAGRWPSAQGLTMKPPTTRPSVTTSTGTARSRRWAIDRRRCTRSIRAVTARNRSFSFLTSTSGLRINVAPIGLEGPTVRLPWRLWRRCTSRAFGPSHGPFLSRSKAAQFMHRPRNVPRQFAWTPSHGRTHDRTDELR